MSESNSKNACWLVAGLRTPFSKIDDALAQLDAIQLSVPVVQAMIESGGESIRPDIIVWGTVAPNLGYSNIAREVLLDSQLYPSIPAFSTVMACSTSMVGVFEAAGMLGSGDRQLALVGGAESMSRIQMGLSEKLSVWLRQFFEARSLGQRVSSLKELGLGDVRLYIPSITNRTTSKSMGEHTEEMAKEWGIPRDKQDKLALQSHKRAVLAWQNGFFDDLVIPINKVKKDTLPRADTSLDRLASLRPVFDRNSGQGTLTAGNSSPLTDGAAGIWVAIEQGLQKFPNNIPRVKLVDWEIAAVNIQKEGLLMGPAYTVPRLLARHDLTYDAIDLWEIHEAFAAQVYCNIAAFEEPEFLRKRVGIDAEFGPFPWDRINPNGGSIALGHPFGATGARILSQAVKELAAFDPGARAVVSICADGGLATAALLQAA